jgi:hypothetical protein
MQRTCGITDGHRIAHEVAAGGEIGIIRSIADDSDIFIGGSLVESRGQQAVVLQIPDRREEPGRHSAG